MPGLAAEQHLTLPGQEPTACRAPHFPKRMDSSPQHSPSPHRQLLQLQHRWGTSKKVKKRALVTMLLDTVVPTHVSFFLVWS